MRNWEEYVRKRLTLPDLTPGRENRIVRELAGQLEEFYRDAIARGLDAEEADDYACRQVPDWGELISDVCEAERRNSQPYLERVMYRAEEVLPQKGRRWNVALNVLRDVRYTVRQLRKSPGFTVVAVLTLAIGIGANTAIFSVVDAVLLRPLPYPEPDRIISFAWLFPDGPYPANVTPLTYHYWHDRARAFDGFAVTSGSDFNFVSGNFAERVKGVSGTAETFKVIGVPPMIGRGFRKAECEPGGDQVVVITYGLWQRAFNGTPNVIGKVISLNDRPYTVIGVLPATFAYETAVDLWYPLQLRFDPRDRGKNYEVLARLRSGVTLEQAQAETDGLFQQFRSENRDHVSDNVRGIALLRYQDFLVADTRPLLLVLLGAVGLVLLIACSNVANLLLARSAARQRDVAIGSALGATTIRLAWAAAAEGLLLVLAGGLVGAGLAFAAVRTLVALIPWDLPRLNTVVVDNRVLAFALAISVAVGLSFALLGAIRLLKNDPGVLLKAAAGTGIDPMRRRLSNALVTGQVAVSAILLVGACLLAATFMNLRSIRVGFDTDDVVTLQLPLSSARYGSAAAVSQLDRNLAERIGAIPGVSSVTTASTIPLERGPNYIFGVVGEPAEKVHYVEIRVIGPNYFRTLGIPLEAGRALTESDTGDSRPIVVVNQMLASLFGGSSQALGHSIVLGRTAPHEDVPREIVGVVSNVADGRPGTRGYPTVYVARSQIGTITGTAAVLIRTSGKVNVASDLRQAVREIDPQLPVTAIRSMNEVASTALAQQRFNMLLMSLFAAVALLLTMVGLYGLLNYQVLQRTREIGVRMALGAPRADVLRMIVARGVILTSIGLVLGVAASMKLTGLLKSLLYGITPMSAWVFVAVSGMLLAVAFLASFLPARRAMRVDPVTALRCE